MAEQTNKIRRFFSRRWIFVWPFLLLFLISCSEIKQPAGDSFFATTPPPPKQEFRWSNGRMPKHLDPARAAAAPETDIVRAMYEGLTEIDPVTLDAIPGVAEKWASSDDLKTWTFTLRENAVWSNGKPVTAQHFAMSWARLSELGSRAAHPQLMANIVGMAPPTDSVPDSVDNDFITNGFNPQNDAAATPVPDANTNSNTTAITAATADVPQKEAGNKGPVQGFRAIDERTFEVKLLLSDKDFPKLVANPIFMPVYAHEKEFESGKLTADVVTNGAFRLVSVEAGSLTLERSETYWNRDKVTLERVVFKPAARAEDALLAYRSGELDAVTNATFEPLALKLLEPYEDFRKGAFAALNYYKVNTEKPPFSDRRVRQALAMSIERERLTEGELEGSTRPAYSFLPFASGSQKKLIQDSARARDLLEEAGFPEGDLFPVIRLVVNRNDAQQRVARSVARMWKQNLNLETEIIVKETAEIDSAIKAGEFDLVRRGAVLPTVNESAGMAALFGLRESNGEPTIGKTPQLAETSPRSAVNANTAINREDNPTSDADETLTEEFAIFELEAIPLYFPVSFALVKPYVLGFDMNVLDAPLLRNVRIDNNWQPKNAEAES